MAKKKFKPEMLIEIEKYAQLGLWEKDIANVLGFHENYFYAMKNQIYPSISEAIKRGRSKLKASLLQKIRTAGDGAWQANCWLAERLWQDEFAIKQKFEHTGNFSVSFDSQDKAL